MAAPMAYLNGTNFAYSTSTSTDPVTGGSSSEKEWPTFAAPVDGERNEAAFWYNSMHAQCLQYLHVGHNKDTQLNADLVLLNNGQLSIVEQICPALGPAGNA